MPEFHRRGNSQEIMGQVMVHWIETINIRSGGGSLAVELEQFLDEIRTRFQVRAVKGVQMEMYRGRFLDGDWTIFLRWETAEPPVERSGLGTGLADQFRPLALVDHSVWIACDQPGRPE